jgi:uncharacterized protein involved in exopolysaccharide biosynthesis
MLQKIDFEDDFQEAQADRSYLLQPAFYWELFKRRWAFFLIPFILIAPAGIAVAYLLPPTFLSEGKILVQSQQIPSELVRPTVTSAAQERIQVIQQRTMTRDNLIAIADKFQLYPEKRTLMSPTELVQLVRKNTKFAPVDLPLDFKQRSQNPTIIFSVGFEYGDAAMASRVANELMTLILNEDLRDRTNRATDTTKFLAREVQRLQAESAAVDSKIAQLKLSQGKATGSTRNDQASPLDLLRAELAQKSALYSDRHPQIQSLKRQIEAMEKAAPPAPAGGSAATAANLDTLTSQQEALQKSLETASSKLAAARLGENLEKEQQSEKLEIIEQPTTPQEPIKPNRPKIVALAVLAGLMTGIGLSFVAEISNRAIRRSSDIFSIVDSKLVVSIPYIVTAMETRRKRRRVLLLGVCFATLLTAVAVGVYLFMPPLDLLVARARVGLFR